MLNDRGTLVIYREDGSRPHKFENPVIDIATDPRTILFYALLRDGTVHKLLIKRSSSELFGQKEVIVHRVVSLKQITQGLVVFPGQKLKDTEPVLLTNGRLVTPHGEYGSGSDPYFAFCATEHNIRAVGVSGRVYVISQSHTDEVVELELPYRVKYLVQYMRVIYLGFAIVLY